MAGTEKYRGQESTREELADGINFRWMKCYKPFFCVVKRPAFATEVKVLKIPEDKRIFKSSGTRVILSETSQK